MTPTATAAEPRAETSALSAVPRGRVRSRIAWVFVAGCYLLMLFGRAWPQELRKTGAEYVGVSLAAFWVRTFEFHIGAGLLAATAIGFLTGPRRPALALAPLAAWCLLAEFNPAQRAVRPPAAGERLRIVSANLLAWNEELSAIADEIRAARPDVLLLQEYTPRARSVFQASSREALPHADEHARDDTFGMAIFSNRPFLRPVELLNLGGSGTPHQKAVIEFAGRELTILNLHVCPPISIHFERLQRLEIADLLDVLDAGSGPRVVGGDFNFTRNCFFGDELARRGLVDTHELAGHGRGVTWSVRGWRRYVPGVRIDHVYLSDELTATFSATGVGTGSDHRPVIAELAFCAP